MTASGLKTKRQETKAAAEAAAAAAADACAICEKVYGEDMEKDESWIACDRCNRWYHGTCVGMTQVQSCCCLVSLRPLVLSVRLCRADGLGQQVVQHEARVDH